MAISDARLATTVGAVWMGMGAACLLAPKPLLSVSLHPRFLPVLNGDKGDEAKDLALFTFRCFGAQAVMCGSVIATTRFDRSSWLWFGAAILPFFAFDYAAWKARYLSTFGALGDLAGNIVFTAGAALGAGLVTLGKAKST